MPFTADIATPVGQVRYLVGDAVQSGAIFPDDTVIQGFLNMSDQSLYLACALASDSMASAVAANLNDLKLGSLEIDESSKVEALQKQASRFRELEYNTPAFAIIEENLSSFNELTIIRNYILRTEM